MVIAVCWLILENRLAEFVEDSKLQTVFFENWWDVLYREPVCDVFFCFVNCFRMLARVMTFRFSAFQRAIVIEIVNAVYKALVFCIVLFAECLCEGACFHVKLCGGKAVKCR